MWSCLPQLIGRSGARAVDPLIIEDDRQLTKPGMGARSASTVER